MALLRRYGLYTVLAVGFIYMLWSLSFPYEQPGDAPINGNPHQQSQQPQRNQKYKSFNWAKVPFKNRIENPTPLPTGEPKALPPIQFSFGQEDATAKNIRETRKGRRTSERIDFGYTDLDRVNVFETNIRHLGGLLSAFELSGDQRLLNKAKEAGEMVTRVLEEQQDKTKLHPGMWPIVVNARKAEFTGDSGFTLGSMADSTYEYFGKQYALLGGQDPIYRKMYERAMDTASKHVLFRPSTPENSDMLMSGFVRAEGAHPYLDPEMQHLACYTGGMFALGGKMFQNNEHVTIGRKLADTCVWAYIASPSGIMPEVSHLLKCANTTTCVWDEKEWLEGIASRTSENAEEKDPIKNIANLRLPSGFTSIDDRRYILRPEAIESVFVMYRITGEQQWQAAAWDMWTAIQRSTDTDIGNSALVDVSADSPPRADSMESFWMAETLKYFYLTFSEPNVISLDDWVFNTEAHPFKIPKPKAA
ncbi:unnamed protein product [Alternaria alternata]